MSHFLIMPPFASNLRSHSLPRRVFREKLRKLIRQAAIRPFEGREKPGREVDMIENALKLIEERKFVELARLLKEENAADIAVLLGEVEETALPVVYRILPKELAAETFVEMDPDRRSS